VKAETRFPAWERTVAQALMAVLGTSDTIRELAEAVSGATANQDYEDLLVRIAEMADERERSSLLPDDDRRWLTATELVDDPRCNEALAQLLTRKGGDPPKLRANNLPAQLAAFKDQAAAGFRLRIKEMVKAPRPGEKSLNRPYTHFTAEPTD
jgi:hypothetical protein